MANGIVTAQDPLGFSRLAQMNLANRELDIKEQDALQRQRLGDLQIATAQREERSQLATLARQQKLRQGLQQALANIPEGQNRFSVTHSFLQQNGFQAEADKMISDRLAQIEQIETIDPKAADKAFNESVGLAQGLKAETTINQDGKFIDFTETATGQVSTFRDTPGSPADPATNSPAGLTRVEGFVKTGKAAAAPGGTNLSKLIADREALAPNDPNRKLFDQAIRKEVQPTGARIADSKAAQDFIEFRVKGKEGDLLKGVNQLQDVVDRLGTGRNLTGPVIGRTPDVILSVTNPEAIDTRELIEEVVQRNLKAILGGQFTEREGEKLVKRAYNPFLDESTNARRVTNLLAQMNISLKARQAAADYFEANRTLEGFEGKIPSLADFRRLNLDKQPEIPIKAAPAAAQSAVSQAIEFLGFE